MTENRNGLVVAAMATQASTVAERQAALEMLKRLKRGKRMTLGQGLSRGEVRQWAAQFGGNTARGRVRAQP